MAEKYGKCGFTDEDLNDLDEFLLADSLKCQFPNDKPVEKYVLKKVRKITFPERMFKTFHDFFKKKRKS